MTLWRRPSSIKVREAVFSVQRLERPFERLDAGAGFGVTPPPHDLARTVAGARGSALEESGARAFDP